MCKRNPFIFIVFLRQLLSLGSIYYNSCASMWIQATWWVVARMPMGRVRSILHSSKPQILFKTAAFILGCKQRLESYCKIQEMQMIQVAGFPL